jgi:hypothetical protein
MQEAILKSNFLGRDGFRWWIGQVAPIEAQGNQANGGGWGNRYKVRIMGYHPFDDTELPNNDLPWAQCLLPTTSGTGAAQTAENTKLKPGDVVFGFYLDSDNAQSPVIMGAFGRTNQVLTEHYSSPFVPFTGSTDRIKKPNGKVAPNESNQQNANSVKSPRSVDTQTATKLNAAGQNTTNGPNAELSYSSVIGQKTVFANTCQDNSISTITSVIDNLISTLQAAGNKISAVKNAINRAISKINSIMSGMVGQMFNYLYTELTSILQKGLKLLYETTFATVLAANLPNPAAPLIAHLAGVAQQTAMVSPVGILTKAIPCVAGKILQGLEGMISSLVGSLLNQVENLTECASNQFVGSMLNNLISNVESGLSSAIDGVTKILPGAFSVANTLLGAVGAIQGLAGLFDCNQDSKSKCSSLTTQWKTGTGGSNSAPDFNAILSNMNVAASLGSLTNPSNFDIYQPSTKNPRAPVSPLGGCYTGPPTHCNTPTISIFGGQGSGATATAIMGSIINYAANSESTITQTASVIGAVISNGGSGYKFPPNVAFSDNCNQGYGAVGKGVINDAGQLIAITMVSSGEFYPVDTPENLPPYSVNSVVVDEPGKGYSTGDTATDNLGNTYTLTVSNGQVISAQPINTNIISDLPTITINSNTGVGAVLKPIIGVAPNPFPGTQGQVVDSNQCYTK